MFNVTTHRLLKLLAEDNGVSLSIVEKAAEKVILNFDAVALELAAIHSFDTLVVDEITDQQKQDFCVDYFDPVANELVSGEESIMMHLVAKDKRYALVHGFVSCVFNEKW